MPGNSFGYGADVTARCPASHFFGGWELYHIFISFLTDVKGRAFAQRTRQVDNVNFVDAEDCVTACCGDGAGGTAQWGMNAKGFRLHNQSRVFLQYLLRDKESNLV
jgi:hypothetical protein